MARAALGTARTQAAWQRCVLAAGRRSARSRPDLSEPEVLAMLRVEVGLLHAPRPTWSSVLDLDGDEPLLEIPVENIDEMILDGELLPYRRNGRWVATPDG